VDNDILGTSAASRRTFLKTTALAAAGVGLGGMAFPLAAHAATDDPGSIIGVALVAEYLAVTFQTNALANADAIGLTPAERTTIQAVVATEALHVDYLTAYGAKAPYQGPFSFPMGTFSSRTGYASTAVILETAFVAAYMAATREFAADARADLAQLTYQLGSVEAEHRALSRAVGNFLPYSDVAFETNLIPNVAAAAQVLTTLNFIPSGSPSVDVNAAASASRIVTLAYTAANQNQAMGYINLLTQTTPS